MHDFLAFLPPLKPLLNIFTGLALGVFLASLLEAFNITKKIAKITKPFVRFAHLSDISAAAFAVALFSPASANTMLGEALCEKKLSEKEVVISNLFNSLPSTLTHIPTFFLMSFALIGKAAVIYTSISMCTAVFRTLATVLVGRFLLPASNVRILGVAKKIEEEIPPWQKALQSAWKRFKKRMPRMLFIGIPIYFLMYYLQYFGYFNMLETFLIQNLGFDFLKPESLSIIVFYMAAELRASLIAGGTAYQAGSITANEVVLALLIGNVLSTPMRGIRHQLPAYASYYPPSFAVKLIFYNQFSRITSLALVAVLYYIIVF